MSESKYPIRLKNKYIRQLSGHPFRVLTANPDIIGRIEYELQYNSAYQNEDGSPLIIRLKNPDGWWNEEGNLERQTSVKEDTWVDFPEGIQHDGNGTGKYVRPRVKDGQIQHRQNGEPMLESKFKFFAAVEIETLEPVTVQLPRPKKDEHGKEVYDVEGKLVFEKRDFTGTKFIIELSAPGKGQQYAKMMNAITAQITSKQDAAKAIVAEIELDANGQPVDAGAAKWANEAAQKMLALCKEAYAVVTLIHAPDAPKEGMYTFTATLSKPKEQEASSQEPQPSTQAAIPYSDDPEITLDEIPF